MLILLIDNKDPFFRIGLTKSQRYYDIAIINNKASREKKCVNMFFSTLFKQTLTLMVGDISI